MKEPFLLTFATAWTVVPWLVKTINRGRSGIPYENQLAAKLGISAIGVALLILWYSLPGSK